MRFQYRFSKSKPKRFGRKTRKVNFFLTQKDFYISVFGKEIVKFYYNHIYKEKTPVVIPNKIDNQIQTSLFNLLCNTRKTAGLIFAAFFMLFFIPSDLISQSTEGKTVQGYIEDHEGEPRTDGTVKIYEEETEIGSGEIENGYFSIDDVVTDVEETGQLTPIFTLENNYPNPFNPSTKIRFSIDHPQQVTLKVYDVLGQEVKTLVDDFLNTGSYETSWKADNENRQGVAAGMYIYRLKGEEQVKNKKMILLDGSHGTSPEKATPMGAPKMGLLKGNSTQSTPYRLEISGENVLTTTIYNIELDGESPIIISTPSDPIVAPDKPELTGFVYDLDTKWNDENERLIPEGIEGMEVILGSDPEIKTQTGPDGRFTLKVDKTGPDSLIVMNTADTTYYFWKNPNIELEPGENIITAFNDTTGIPLFKRYKEAGTGRDLLDVIVHHTDVKNKAVGDEWDYTTKRFKDEDLPIKTYMNRDAAPNDWYADSSWTGLKAMEVGRFQFTEVADSNDAMLIMRYNHTMVGQGKNIQTEFDEFGPFYTHYEIWIRGPPGGPILNPPEYIPHITAHESLHIAFAGGEHSQYMQDMFYGDTTTRFSQGYPLAKSEIERSAIKTIWDMERNPKLLHYFK